MGKTIANNSFYFNICSLGVSETQTPKVKSISTEHEGYIWTSCTIKFVDHHVDNIGMLNSFSIVSKAYVFRKINKSPLGTSQFGLTKGHVRDGKLFKKKNSHNPFETLTGNLCIITCNKFSVRMSLWSNWYLYPNLRCSVIGNILLIYIHLSSYPQILVLGTKVYTHDHVQHR